MRDNRRPTNYNNRDNNRDNRGRDNKRTGRNPYNMLPSSKVLESYEAIAPGSVQKLIDMAKKEQDHRHSWQDKYLKFHNLSYRFGQFFGIIYNFALLFLVIHLIKIEEKSLAIKLFSINAGLIVFAILVTFVERKLITRKPPRRGPNNQNNQRREPNRKPQEKKS
jgi:uncharacterized membrane protein